MTVSAAWTNPSAAGVLDLGAGSVVTETHWDAMVSNFLYLAGASGLIGTSVLAANAVTATGVGFPSGDFSTTSTSLITAMTANLTTTGGGVYVFACGPGHATTQSGALTIQQDDVVSTTHASIAAGTTVNAPWMVLAFFSPSAGAHTYKLKANVISGGTISMNFASAAAGIIVALELRR